VEKARQAGQVPPGSTIADGTFASGVQKMTELLPVMMNELIQTAPENQKVRFYVALPSDQLHIPLQLDSYCQWGRMAEQYFCAAWFLIKVPQLTQIEILGEGFETDWHLGARTNISSPAACQLQAKTERSPDK
jgi:hypothetical protein